MKIEILGQNLRMFRIAKGYTQESMSIKLNIQRQTYCNYENGRRLPNIEIILEISKILEVSLDLLVFDPESSSFAIPVDELADREVLLKLVIDYQSLSETSQQQVLDFINFHKSISSNSDFL